MPRNKKNAPSKRKLIRKMRTESNCKPSKKTTPTKLAMARTPAQPQQKSAGANRREGMRLFKLAGRPTKEQFTVVYGARGAQMTWAERAKAGVPAEKFQAALAQKGEGHPSKAAAKKKKAARPARAAKKSVRTPEATGNILDQIPATQNTGN